MQHLNKYLQHPYPLPVKALETIATGSLLVFALLYIFQPFGIQYITGGQKFFVLLGYAAVTAAVMCLQYYLLPLLFPCFFCERRWTVGRHILSNIVHLVLIALGNAAYSCAFSIIGHGFEISLFVWALGVTVAVGIFPITLISILQQNRLLAISLREASQINASLTAYESNPVPAESTESLPILRLAGFGKDDRLEIDAGSLIYMEACGNYIKVNYLKDGAAAQKILRATLKQMDDATADYPFIIKCHRAFIVNLDTIRQVKGNSQGYRLTLNGTKDEVPVARAFTRAVKSKIKRLPG
jgi:hypothetical protein